MTATEKPVTDKPPADEGSKIQGEGDYESARRFGKDAERFLKNADVPELAREAEPHSDAEAAEMKKAEEIGRSHRHDLKPGATKSKQ